MAVVIGVIVWQGKTFRFWTQRKKSSFYPKSVCSPYPRRTISAHLKIFHFSFFIPISFFRRRTAANANAPAAANCT
jgi:hypothetical protein